MSTVLRGEFRAGEGNQLIVFQKVVCLALSLHARVAAPSMFHCDKTTARENCSEVDTFPLSRRARKILTQRPATRTISEAYYIADKCRPRSAFGLPDITGFGELVRYYGEALRAQCPPPCIVVQWRTGKDWVRHTQAFPGAFVNASVLQTILDKYRGHNFVSLTPETSRDALPFARLVHQSGVHPTMRFLGEIYVATRARIFFYNDLSTTHHVVRRLAPRSLMLRRLNSQEL